MIRIEKLMLGDWVLFNDPDTLTSEYHRIEEEDFVAVGRYYSCFEYVPLTDDMMHRNFPDYEPGYEIGWWPNDDGSFSMEYQDEMCDMVMKRVWFVHEVQHLLNLIGSGKEIVI